MGTLRQLSECIDTIKTLNDTPEPWGLFFQDNATPQMEGLEELHNNIFFYLSIILFFVCWIFASIIINFSLFYISNKYVNHGTLVELIWTITPALILILIAFPSFKLLYLMDEVIDPALVIYGEGHQWYWSAPFNYMKHRTTCAAPAELEYKGIGLPNVEKLGDHSMPTTVVWEGPYNLENAYQPTSVMICLYTFFWVNIALVSSIRTTKDYLMIFSKVQLEYISAIKRSLQRVGHNVKSKTDNKVSYKNWGFPKGCKSYGLFKETGWLIIGNGGSVVVTNYEGSQLSNFAWNIAGRIRKFYSLDSQSKMNSEIKQNNEVSYKQLQDIDLYKSAYLAIKSKPGNMTPGTDKETLDGISLKWVEKIVNSMKDRTFQFKPCERVFIPKSNGKLRPLGIPSPRDKVIQQAIKMIIEPVFEPRFLNYSHGFRPNRSTTTAVSEVRKWNGVTWIIEGDIRGYFDNIDHHILAELLTKRIKDKNILDLYWKLVRAGYVNDGKFTKSHLGVPQGGIISPLLSNIYLHEFDLFMQEMINKLSKPGRVSKANPKYNSLKRKITKLTKDEVLNLEERKGLAELTVELRKTSSVIRTPDTGTRIYYNRYADDWLIGVTGDLDMAKTIKQLASKFLKEELKIELSEEKTKITHTIQDKVQYLGFQIYRKYRKYTESLISTVESTGSKRRPTNASVIIEAPTDKLINKLVEQGFAWEKDKSPKAMTKWVFLNPEDIIRRYNWVIRGILFYYKSVENINQFSYILWILKFSAVNTLARKLNISPKQIWKKFGNPITIPCGEEINNNKKKTIVLHNPDTLKRDRTLKPGEYHNLDPFNVTTFTIRSNSAWDASCLICGEDDNVEMHHVKHIRKGEIKGFTKVMQKLNRKQIPVCRDCHMNIHKGLYDGISLSKLVGKKES